DIVLAFVRSDERFGRTPVGHLVAGGDDLITFRAEDRAQLLGIERVQSSDQGAGAFFWRGKSPPALFRTSGADKQDQERGHGKRAGGTHASSRTKAIHVFLARG